MNSTVIEKVNINDISRSGYGAAYSLMSESRRKKCDSLRREDDRRLCIAADMLLRKTLSSLTGIRENELEFYCEENGKPMLTGGAAYFSISHSGQIAAVAVSRECPVGIDIEKIAPVKAGIARRICSSEEILYIFSSPEIPSGEITDRKILERFFRVWTYKEAYVKMTGEGIDDNIRNVRYSPCNCYQELCDGYCLTVVTKE